MKKVFLLYGVLVVAIAIFFFTREGNFLNFNFGNRNNQAEVSNATVKVGEKTYKLILARTSNEKIKGLSGRENLPKDTGMLFIFEEKGEYGFWMKNMKFPIDILFISDNKIVDLVENAPFPSEDQSASTLPIYKPGEAVNYVLELNAGEVAKSKAKKGDTVEFKGI